MGMTSLLLAGVLAKLKGISVFSTVPVRGRAIQYGNRIFSMDGSRAGVILLTEALEMSGLDEEDGRLGQMMREITQYAM